MVRGMGSSCTEKMKNSKICFFFRNKWIVRLCKLFVAMIIVFLVEKYCFLQRGWDFYEYTNKGVRMKMLIK